MDEVERNQRVSPEIHVYATNKSFLNIYDALRIEKLKIEISGYDPATHRQTGHAAAWLAVDDARLLTHLVCHRLFASVTGGRWEKYGGSQRDDGKVESRTLQLEWDEAGGRFSSHPYRLTIANGPGKKTATGGVSPDGEPAARLSMRLPESDMIKIMLAVRDYIQAYETAHHHRLVAQRVRELRDKLADRALAAAAREESPRRTSATGGSGAPERGRQSSGARPELTSLPGRGAQLSRDDFRAARAG